MNKTQKRTKNLTSNEKKSLWNRLNMNTIPTTPIEELYSSTKTFSNDECSLCKSPIHIDEHGSHICSNTSCGMMIRNPLDQTAEWRFYKGDDTQDPSRSGCPINPLLEQSSYGCRIFCNSKSTYQMRKIRRYTEWHAIPYKEKINYEDFQHITIMANLSGIPKLIINDAMIYHKKISEEQSFRSLNREGVLAASIYISCRINGYPRTAKEIADIFNLDTSSATKGCKNALLILNKLEKNMDYDDKTQLTQATPSTFLERYCTKLNFPSDLMKLCLFISMKIKQYQQFHQKSPHSIAVGIIYYVSCECNQDIKKSVIKDISHVSEVTINKCYKMLKDLNKPLIPKIIKQKYVY